MRQFDRRLLYHFDLLLFAVTLSLVALGILTLYSATYGGDGSAISRIVVRQIVWALIGLVGMMGAVFLDYRHLERHAYAIYVVCLLLLLLVAQLGNVGGGSRRWLSLAGLSLQPSEFMKIALAAALARYWSRARILGESSIKDLFVPGLFFLLPAGLIVMQPDLGTAVSLATLFGSVALFTGLRWRSFFRLLLAGAAAIPLLWTYLQPYQRERVKVFFRPEMDPLGAGYHVIQSKIAIGSGGLWGKGFLHGTQSQLHFLPEQHTDFIFSVFAEEWGFIGVLALLALYLALIGRGLMLVTRAKDRFGSLLAFALLSVIFWQIIINVAMTLGALPVVGITLPFFSYGGSSLTVMMIGVGILINISTRRFTF